MLQSTRYKIIIYSLATAILVSLLGFWLYFAKAQMRDYQRLADLKVWQNILSDYYAHNGTYKIALCDPGAVISGCFGNKLDDPVNVSQYRYIVADLSDSDFAINFSLEAGLGGLKPGQYVWTKEGVKR